MFEAADLNKDGSIDFNEFLIMRRRAGRSREAKDRAAQGVRRRADSYEAEHAALVENPKWVEAAREVERARKEAAAEARKQAERVLRTRLDVTDSVYELDDDELRTLEEMLGGKKALVDGETVHANLGMLGIRLGKLFSDAEIRALVARLKDLYQQVSVREMIKAMRTGSRVDELEIQEGAKHRRGSLLKIHNADGSSVDIADTGGYRCNS